MIKMVDKIIFLDIDGPMIPGTKYLENVDASWEQDLCSRCIMVLRKIIDESGAKIVFNTTHNYMWEQEEFSPLLLKSSKIDSGGIPGLKNVFIEAGFKNDIHPTAPRTLYPDISNRLDAINVWLVENRTEQMLWIALDDVKIDHKRALLVDFNHGIGMDAYNHAAKYLMFRPCNIL